MSIFARVLTFLIFAAITILSDAEWYSVSEDIMGTKVSVELWHDDKTTAEKSMAAVMNEMHAVDQGMSPYIPSSELYKLNSYAAEKPVVVSSELFSLIEKSLYFSNVSGGAFDISFSSVGRFYDYRDAVSPVDAEIKKNLSAINYKLIEIDKAKRSVRFNHPQMKIDLGGIAKGYAVDRAIDELQSRGITSAIVSAGGDSRILGERRGNPWLIGIRHPRKDDENAVRIPLVDSAISTSGDYERFYMDGEIRVHHILNPQTGKSALSLQSASILTPLAVDSDALSTTVFVLGVDEGLQLVNSLNKVEAILIDRGGMLHYSEGLLRATK